MRNLQSGQKIKDSKQMPKWELLNQIAKILPLKKSSIPNRSSSFSSKQTLYRSIAKGDLHSPKRLNKKLKVSKDLRENKN